MSVPDVHANSNPSIERTCSDRLRSSAHATEIDVITTNAAETDAPRRCRRGCNDAVADGEVAISQEEGAQARPRASDLEHAKTSETTSLGVYCRSALRSAKHIQSLLKAEFDDIKELVTPKSRVAVVLVTDSGQLQPVGRLTTKMLSPDRSSAWT